MAQVVLPNSIDPGTPIVASEHQQNFQALRDAINGALDADNLAAALAVLLGVSVSGTPRRGKAIIPTQETTTSLSYVTLATADKVTVNLPTDGLIFIVYQATWKASIASGGRAAIFIDTNQLKRVAGTVPTPNDESTPADTNFHSIATASLMLGTDTGGAFTGDVTTGEAIGNTGTSNPIVPVFVTAGSHDVSVRYKAISPATVTVKDRRLWVWTMGF